MVRRYDRNENGFMFPVTLGIMLLFTLFLTISINHYLTEKRFALEVVEFQRNQYYFHRSLYKLENQLMNGGYANSGDFHYENGTVTYFITEHGPYNLQINLHLVTNREQELTGIAYFDSELNRMTKWIERN